MVEACYKDIVNDLDGEYKAHNSAQYGPTISSTAKYIGPSVGIPHTGTIYCHLLLCAYCRRYPVMLPLTINNDKDVD